MKRNIYGKLLFGILSLVSSISALQDSNLTFIDTNYYIYVNNKKVEIDGDRGSSKVKDLRKGLQDASLKNIGNLYYKHWRKSPNKKDALLGNLKDFKDEVKLLHIKHGVWDCQHFVTNVDKVEVSYVKPEPDAQIPNKGKKDKDDKSKNPKKDDKNDEGSMKKYALPGTVLLLASVGAIGTAAYFLSSGSKNKEEEKK